MNFKCLINGHLWLRLTVDVYNDAKNKGGYSMKLKQCEVCMKVKGLK